MCIILMSVVWLSAAQQTSVTQYGITWTFDKTYEVGQFANGDYWVVGPVTIDSVSIDFSMDSVFTVSTPGRNGSVVNPMPGQAQGYDDRVDPAWVGVNDYDADLRALFPLVLQPNQSLVSTISDSIPPGGAYWAPLQTAAVLTAVSAIPAEVTFRPPFCGSSYKPFFPVSRLHRELLPGVAPTASIPSVGDYERKFQRIWLDHKSGWRGRSLHPQDNMSNYGLSIGVDVSIAAGLLMTSAATDQLLYNFIQTGIDLYGMAANGLNWSADGGHANGRKWPILFAGIMLDAQELKDVSVAFGEDGHTYYGNNGRALWGRTCVPPFTFASDDDSCPTSGPKDCRDPAGLLDARCYRNCCTSLSWVGAALAGRMMHAEAVWNHDAFFDYVDRWMGYGNEPPVAYDPEDYYQPGETWSAFIKKMWVAYRNNLPSGVAPNRQSLNGGRWSSYPLRYDACAQTVTLPVAGRVQLYDIQGRLVLQAGREQAGIIDVSALAAGVYGYKLRTSHIEQTGTIVIFR
jgi:hypothetical protein